MTDMTPEEIQAETQRRMEEDRQNQYLIAITMQRQMSDFLKRTYGQRLSSKEKLSHTSSHMAIATADYFSQNLWLQRLENGP